jgi:putative Mg2+ transporter-C (MgtC) family protein
VIWPQISPHWLEISTNLRLDLLASLAVSGLLGAAVGLEREIHGKPAGLRVNVLICTGACVFTQLSAAIGVGGQAADPTRIAAQIVSGVGFIGAGTILRGKGNVSGLASAATIWLVAAIGMAVGAGWILEAVGTTLFTLFVLAVLGRLERHIQRRADTSEMVVRVRADSGYLERLEEIVGQSGARVEGVDSKVDGEDMTVRLKMRGAKHSRDQAKLSVMRASRIMSVSDLDGLSPEAQKAVRSDDGGPSS